MTILRSVRITLRLAEGEQDLVELVTEFGGGFDPHAEPRDNNGIELRTSIGTRAVLPSDKGEGDGPLEVVVAPAPVHVSNRDVMRVENARLAHAAQTRGDINFFDGMLSGRVGHDGVTRIWRWDAEARRNVLIESTDGAAA